MADDLLAHLPIFEGLEPAHAERLRSLLSPCDCFADETLFEQGCPAEYFYLVLSGEVVVRYKPEDGEALNLARVRPGGLVGWSAALGSRFYTSGAYCSVTSQLLRLRGEDLRRLCESDPDTGRVILERLASVVAERLHNTRDQVIALLEQSIQASVCPHS